MKTEMLAITDPNALAMAIDVLASGGLVAFPTDTVYGLGALVFNEMAVSKISDVRGRHSEKAITVLVGDMAQLERVAYATNPLFEKLALRFWPGPLTMLLPRLSMVPEAVTPLPTIGLRIPDFAPTLQLLKLTGPLAVSTANLDGESSPSTARGVEAQLRGKIPLILDGGVTPGGIPSTIVDMSKGNPQLIREGPITFEQILNALAD